MHNAENLRPACYLNKQLKPTINWSSRYTNPRYLRQNSRDIVITSRKSPVTRPLRYRIYAS